MNDRMSQRSLLQFCTSREQTDIFSRKLNGRSVLEGEGGGGALLGRSLLRPPDSQMLQELRTFFKKKKKKVVMVTQLCLINR